MSEIGTLHVKNAKNEIYDCVIYDSTDEFPYKQHINIKLPSGKIGYLVLDDVGNEYDSGLRILDNKSNTYQVCTQYVVDITKKYLTQDNYLINIVDYNYLYTSFKNIFGSKRVQLDKDCIYITTPSIKSGITKMLMIGLNISISFDDITLTTYNNGICNSDYGAANSFCAKTMLVKFEERKQYKIEFADSYSTIHYTSNIKNGLYLGKDVELLAEKSSTYSNLLKTNSYCLTDPNTGLISNGVTSTDNMYNWVNNSKNLWLAYPKSEQTYNYFELENFKYDKM